MNEQTNDAFLFVKRKIHYISQLPESAAKSTLAQLRRGAGKHPGSSPELWEITLDGLPESFISKEWQGQPTNGEWAVHIALTLYALHQQGHHYKTDSMSKDGEKFGRAIRKLAPTSDDLPRIKRRFDAAVTSESIEELSHHLRGLIQLLKADSIRLDYPDLSQDLYWFQTQKIRDSIRLKWGQDFYRYQKEEENNE